MSAGSMNTRFRRRRLALTVLSVFGTYVLASTVFCLSRPTPVQRLQPYLGKDLRTLSENEQIKFDGLIGRLTPEARAFIRPALPRGRDPRDWQHYLTARPFAIWPHSWYLWRVANGKGRDRLALFQCRSSDYWRGGSGARIFVFDVAGNPLTECKFSTPWWSTIEDARWLQDSGHGFPCLLLCCHGPDIASQYYALLEDTVALVRIEDSDGKFVPNVYHTLRYTIGPHVTKRTPVQWEAALDSQDRAEVLRTLVWLGGDHYLPPLCFDSTEAERFEDGARALETRARPRVRSAVETLTRSEDRWVREAAQRASQVIREGGR